MVERKWQSTVGDMLDRISILELKHLHNPSQREAIKQEIEFLVHDINLALPKNTNVIHAEFLRELIILAQFNAHIFANEDNARNGDKNGNKLYFTHECNGVRCRSRDRMNKRLNNRTDPKVNAIAADVPDFEPYWLP